MAGHSCAHLALATPTVHELATVANWIINRSSASNNMVFTQRPFGHTFALLATGVGNGTIYLSSYSTASL